MHSVILRSESNAYSLLPSFPGEPLAKPGVDPRRHPYRDDLAAEALRGIVPAPRYVEGKTRRVMQAATGLWTRPEPGTGWATEVLFGGPMMGGSPRRERIWISRAA